MHGPEPRGHWTASRPQGAFKHLTPGERYDVFQAFTDYDGRTHPVGENWRFVGHNFLPQDDGLSLFVSLDDEREWHIRLQWRPDQQGALIDNLEGHIRAIAASRIGA